MELKNKAIEYPEVQFPKVEHKYHVKYKKSFFKDMIP